MSYKQSGLGSGDLMRFVSKKPKTLDPNSIELPEVKPVDVSTFPIHSLENIPKDNNNSSNIYGDNSSNIYGEDITFDNGYIPYTKQQIDVSKYYNPKMNVKQYSPGMHLNKATRNNNPGNITGMGGKLLYGAIGFARSNTGDAGDHVQLVFKTPQDGFKAMHKLMSSERYNKEPISKAFKQYQTDMNAYNNILKEYRRKGINVDRLRYNDLTPAQKAIFLSTRARFEGYQGPGLDIKQVFR